MKNTVKKHFDLFITQPDKVVAKTFELDKNIAVVKGILFTSDKDDLMYYRGSQKVEINKQEIYPEGYETKLLMSGINVSPNHRYHVEEDIVVGNGSLKVEYTDKSDGRTTFEPYRVRIYLNCQLA